MYGMRYHKAISFTDMTQTNVYSDSSLMGFEYWDCQPDGRARHFSQQLLKESPKKKKKKKGSIYILFCCPHVGRKSMNAAVTVDFFQKQ